MWRSAYTPPRVIPPPGGDTAAPALALSLRGIRLPLRRVLPLGAADALPPSPAAAPPGGATPLRVVVWARRGRRRPPTCWGGVDTTYASIDPID